MHSLRGRSHAFSVYGIMHFYVETIMQALSQYIYMDVFVLNAIFIIHNIWIRRSVRSCFDLKSCYIVC